MAGIDDSKRKRTVLPLFSKLGAINRLSGRRRLNKRRSRAFLEVGLVGRRFLLAVVVPVIFKHRNLVFFGLLYADRSETTESNLSSIDCDSSTSGQIFD